MSGSRLSRLEMRLVSLETQVRNMQDKLRALGAIDIMAQIRDQSAPDTIPIDRIVNTFIQLTGRNINMAMLLNDRRPMWMPRMKRSAFLCCWLIRKDLTTAQLSMVFNYGDGIRELSMARKQTEFHQVILDTHVRLGFLPPTSLYAKEAGRQVFNPNIGGTP